MLRRTLPFALLVLACMDDDGVVDPDDPSTKPVAARFQGRAATEGPQAFDPNRLLDFPNPRITLVWEFIGTKVVGTSMGKAAVNVGSPIRFSLEMNGPPPPEIAFSNEPVFGHFWLYSDRNGNGQFDRVTHPEVASLFQILDGLRDTWAEHETKFQATAQTLPALTLVTDTFYIDGNGTLTRQVGNSLDTLYRSQSASDTSAYNDIIFRRYRLLKNYNNWENFFALRKRIHDAHRVETPMENHTIRLIWKDWIRMVPKPGKETEFEFSLKQATMSYLARFAFLNVIERQAKAQGWSDYSYNGFDEPGQDWLAGRSRWYHVVYFPDSTSMRIVLDAERSGSFRVERKERLRLGYNVLHCDDQYRCKVLGPDDPILVDLGQREAYFNPPASPLAYPISDFSPVPAPESQLKRLAGGFRYRPYGPVTTVFAGGHLWADVPKMGLHRLVPGANSTFHVPGRDIQYEFLSTPEGDAYKLLMYISGSRAVCIREDSLAMAREAGERVEARLLQVGVGLSDSLAASLPRSFSHGPDTLKVDCLPGGDTLLWRVPGLPVQPFRPLNDSQAFSPHTGDRISFRRNSQGTVTAMFLSRETGGYLLPNLAYQPRLPADLFPGAPADSLVSFHDGTGQDVYVGMGGKKRYGCSEDRAFLRTGDGWVRSLRKGETGDGISLVNAGDGLVLRLTGLAGKRARMELRPCREGGAGGNGQRMLAAWRGWREANPVPDILAEDHWMEIVPAGQDLSFGPFPVPSDPYDVELSRTSTLDSTFYFAFDRYRIFSE